MATQADSAIERDVRLSVEEYNRISSEGLAAAFRRAKRDARDGAGRLLAQTGDLAGIEPVVLLEDPSLLPALRMACCPPLTRDRLSGLSGVPAKRIGALEDGAGPKRPSGRAKLEEEEMPAIAAAIGSRLDADIAPWLAEGRAPSEAERGMFCACVAERAASMSDSRASTAAIREGFAADVVGWLEARGYTEAGCGTGSYAVLPDAGAGRPPLVEARPAGPNPPVLIDVRVSGDFSNGLRVRSGLEDACDRAARDSGAVVALVLGGFFDAAYVRRQAERGRAVVWHHDLSALAGLGL